MGQKIRRLQLMGHVKIIQMFCRWSSLVSKNKESCVFSKDIHSLFYLQKQLNATLKYFICISKYFLSYIINPLVIVIIQMAFEVIIQDVYAFYAYDRFTSTKKNCILLQPYANETKFNHKSSFLSNSLLTFGIANFFNFNLSFYISGNETSHMCLSEGIHFQFVLMKSI